MNSRRALAGLLAILPLAVLLVASSMLPPPDRVPTHWGGRVPDGWTEGSAFLAQIFTIVAVAAIVSSGAGLLQRMVPQAWSRWLVTITGGIGWGAVTAYIVTVWRTGVDGPDAVGDLWALLVGLVGLLAAAAVFVLHGKVVPTAAELADQIPERSRVKAIRGRGVAEVAPWSTDLHSRTMLVLGLVVWLGMLAAAIFFWWAGEGRWSVLIVAGTGIVVGVFSLLWSQVRVSVDAEGLRVRSGVLPVGLLRIPAEQVAGADVQVLDAMRWGGIGLRPLPDRTAFMIDRGGPGIVVYKRDGRRFALQITEGDAVARAGARTLLQAAGQRLGETSSSA